MHARALCFLLTLLIAVALLGAHAGGSGPAVQPNTTPQRIATCDVYQVVQRLFDSDRYTPARKSEEEAIRAELAPFAEELQKLGDQASAIVQSAPATDAAAQATVRQFQDKRAAFNKKQQESAARLQSFKARQLIECFELGRTSARAVADRAGYDFVLASRRVSEKLPADDPQVVVEAVLQRPALVSPPAADITDDVLSDLKLK